MWNMSLHNNARIVNEEHAEALRAISTGLRMLAREHSVVYTQLPSGHAGFGQPSSLHIDTDTISLEEGDVYEIYYETTIQGQTMYRCIGGGNQLYFQATNAKDFMKKLTLLFRHLNETIVRVMYYTRIKSMTRAETHFITLYRQRHESTIRRVLAGKRIAQSMTRAALSPYTDYGRRRLLREFNKIRKNAK